VAKVNYTKGRLIRKVSISRISVCAIFHKASNASKCKMSDCWLKPNPLEPFLCSCIHKYLIWIRKYLHTEQPISENRDRRELIDLIAIVHKAQIFSSDVYRLFTSRTAQRLSSRFLSGYSLKISSMFSSRFQNNVSRAWPTKGTNARWWWCNKLFSFSLLRLSTEICLR